MAGRKLGAALITANISQVLIFRTEKHENKCYLNLTPNEQHILEHFTSKAGNYRPLVYCWRGGQRSRSMVLILRWTQHCIVRMKIFQRLYVSSTFMLLVITSCWNFQGNRVSSGDLSRRLQRLQAIGARDGPGETWMRSPHYLLSRARQMLFGDAFIEIVDVYPTGVGAEQ